MDLVVVLTAVLARHRAAGGRLELTLLEPPRSGSMVGPAGSMAR